ncbi:MAG TPA: hypothetical protein VF590_05500 [Isosphaeraceae bacterium]|jgi:hypothetical protein
MRRILGFMLGVAFIAILIAGTKYYTEWSYEQRMLAEAQKAEAISRAALAESEKMLREMKAVHPPSP